MVKALDKDFGCFCNNSLSCTYVSKDIRKIFSLQSLYDSSIFKVKDTLALCLCSELGVTFISQSKIVL